MLSFEFKTKQNQKLKNRASSRITNLGFTEFALITVIALLLLPILPFQVGAQRHIKAPKETKENSSSGSGYAPVTIRNGPFLVKEGKVRYAGCRSDSFTIDEYGIWTATTNRGLCLVTKIEAIVVDGVASVVCDPYKSSGTSYSLFYVFVEKHWDNITICYVDRGPHSGHVVTPNSIYL